MLVNGELLVRDTRLRYDGTAQHAYDRSTPGSPPAGPIPTPRGCA